MLRPFPASREAGLQKSTAFLGNCFQPKALHSSRLPQVPPFSTWRGSVLHQTCMRGSSVVASPGAAELCASLLPSVADDVTILAPCSCSTALQLCHSAGRALPFSLLPHSGVLATSHHPATFARRGVTVAGGPGRAATGGSRVPSRTAGDKGTLSLRALENPMLSPGC